MSKLSDWKLALEYAETQMKNANGSGASTHIYDAAHKNYTYIRWHYIKELNKFMNTEMGSNKVEFELPSLIRL